MQNKNKWVVSKYDCNQGKWRASRDSQQVAVGSRLVADIKAAWYEKILFVGKGIAISLQVFTLWFARRSLGERIKNKTAKAFPFGYFMVCEK